MSVNYSVKLIDRTDEENYHTFARGTDIAELSFGFTDPGGCAAFSLTGERDSWASIEDLMVAENLVEVYVNLTGGALPATPSFTGIVQRVDGPKNTPPGRTVRTIDGYGLVAELKKDGLLIFTAFEDARIRTIVRSLLTDFISPATDIDESTTLCTAGYDYIVPRTFFNDIKAEDCLQKLAELSGPTGDTTWGVDGQRHLYFQAVDEDTVVTLQLSDRDSGVMMARHEIGQPGPNALIVSGKEATQGNPMTIYESDVESGGRLRMAKLRAPSLIKGDDMVEWALYLIGRDRDAPENITVNCSGVEGSIATIIPASGQVAVQDEDGGSIGTWPIKAVTYTLKGGGFDAKFELGDVFEPDPSTKLRDLLRDTAVLDSSEFSNQTEIEADTDGFALDAQILFAKYGIRNCVRYDFEGKLDLIDWESDWTKGVRADRSEPGLSSQLGGTQEATFATVPIEMGKTYETYAVYRKCAYKMLLGDDAGSDIANRFRVYDWGDELGVRWDDFQYGDTTEVRPYVHAYDGIHSYASMLLHVTPITEGVDYLLRFRWGEPTSGITTGRFFIFRYYNRFNFAGIHMRKDGSSIRFGLIRRLNGVWNAAAGSEHLLAYTADDEFLLTVDCHTHANGANEIRNKLQNITAGTSSGFWVSAANYLDSLTGTKCGVGSELSGIYSAPGIGVDDWGIQSLTFANAVETGYNDWYVSRDGGESLSPYSLHPDIGIPQYEGPYGGPGTEQTNVIIHGIVIYPQILTKLAVGWTNEGEGGPGNG